MEHICPPGLRHGCPECEGLPIAPVRRARDFEKCTNPECSFTQYILKWNKVWNGNRRVDHCHPIF